MDIIYIVLGVVVLWLLALSAYFIYFFRFVRKFLGSDAKSLFEVLERTLGESTKNTKAISELESELSQVVEDGKNHIQKVSFIRFNPFHELGGDHSFVFTLLDAKDNGIIMTGLHSRERTRLYVKEVKMGKSEIELSKEEGRALSLAQKN